MQQRANGAGTMRAKRAQCLDLIRARLPGLKGTGRVIAHYLLSHAWEVRGLTVSELARAVGVSENAVVRFCQGLGYSGYRAFSSEFALSLGQAGGQSFSIPPEALPAVERNGSPAALVRRMFALEALALQDTERHLSDSLLEQAVNALCQARRVAFGAMGGAAHIAQLGSYRLLLCGIDSLWANDPYVTLANAAILEPGDVAIGISHSGQSRLAIEFLEFARGRGAVTVALTAVPGSPLTTVADFAFVAFGPDVELSPGLQRFASRMAGMVLIEALVAAVAVRQFGAEPPHIDIARAWIQRTLEPPTARERRPVRSAVTNARKTAQPT